MTDGEAEVIRVQEMTEEESRVLRTGLRMLARMIARHHLAVKTVQSAGQNHESEEACAGAEVAGLSGDPP